MVGRIIGTGSYVPDNIVNNDFLSTIVETNDEWIVSRTGIRERRITIGEGTAEMGSKAAIRAIKDSGIEPEEIDMIITATMSADNFLPNASCQIQEVTGAVNAVCFDLNAACSGFVFAINTAHAYINAGLAKTILVVGAETLSKVIDWKDRSTCVLFGDGAGAVIMKRDREGFIDTVSGSDGTKKNALTCEIRKIVNPFCNEEDSTDYIKMEGQEVFRFAVKKVPQCIKQVIENAGIEISDIKYFILHQANERIIDAVAKRLMVRKDRFPMNLQKYGNTSAASIPILLDEINKKGYLHKGDKILMSGFGGGLTWGATLFTW